MPRSSASRWWVGQKMARHRPTGDTGVVTWFHILHLCSFLPVLGSSAKLSQIYFGRESPRPRMGSQRWFVCRNTDRCLPRPLGGKHFQLAAPHVGKIKVCRLVWFIYYTWMTLFGKLSEQATDIQILNSNLKYQIFFHPLLFHHSYPDLEMIRIMFQTFPGAVGTPSI